MHGERGRNSNSNSNSNPHGDLHPRHDVLLLRLSYCADCNLHQLRRIHQLQLRHLHTARLLLDRFIPLPLSAAFV